jgi:hypothetical protein
VSGVFPPLDQKLRLRHDHWSAGAARVATRLGLQAQSFDLAAAAFGDAIGCEISADSLRRITEDWGQAVAAQRQREAERANAVAQRGEKPADRRVEEVEPISGQANLSTDGAMMLVRDEGWKEVKLVAVSEVKVRPAARRASDGPSRRSDDPLVELVRHSYQAGLWNADAMALHQYAEAMRRGLDYSRKRGSVNDGARWIRRITELNFPGITQVVDWTHASDHLWAVGNALYGEQTPAAKRWTERHLDLLWDGCVGEVVSVLDRLELQQERYPALVREAPDFFRSNQGRMRYDVFRAQGYPIGSGTVESGANTVVHHRMRRPGRGWQRQNGQAMLAALSELHSARFDQAWRSIFSLS